MGWFLNKPNRYFNNSGKSFKFFFENQLNFFCKINIFEKLKIYKTAFSSNFIWEWLLCHKKDVYLFIAYTIYIVIWKISCNKKIKIN